MRRIACIYKTYKKKTHPPRSRTPRGSEFLVGFQFTQRMKQYKQIPSQELQLLVRSNLQGIPLTQSTIATESLQTIGQSIDGSLAKSQKQVLIVQFLQNPSPGLEI
jgi:hypothetical protein